jgi:hypothetical protein
MTAGVETSSSTLSSVVPTRGQDRAMRWWGYTHPSDPLPAKLPIPLWDQVRSIAAHRVLATVCACQPEIVRQIERQVINYGLPTTGIRPILDSENREAPTDGSFAGISRQ